MGRWIVIISLAMAQYADVGVAAPLSSELLPLPKPRPARRDHPPTARDLPSTAKSVATSRTRPALASAASRPTTDAPALEPARKARVEEQIFVARPPDTSAQTKSSRTRSNCRSGKRIISAYYSQGRRTASGQLFDPHGMTAAHRTLPFGTRLTVSNPRTGKSVTVVINDRGPFVSGVSLDLSLGAAEAIGMRGTGAVCIW